MTTPTGDPMTLKMELLIAFSSNRTLTSDHRIMKVVLLLCSSILAATFGAPLDSITEEDSEEARDAEEALDTEEARDAGDDEDARDDEDDKDPEDDEDAEDDEDPEDDTETVEDTVQIAEGRMADAKRHHGGKHHGQHGHHGGHGGKHYDHHGHHGHHHHHNPGLVFALAGEIVDDIAFAGELLLLDAILG